MPALVAVVAVLKLEPAVRIVVAPRRISTSSVVLPVDLYAPARLTTTNILLAVDCGVILTVTPVTSVYVLVLFDLLPLH